MGVINFKIRVKYFCVVLFNFLDANKHIKNIFLKETKKCLKYAVNLITSPFPLHPFYLCILYMFQVLWKNCAIWNQMLTFTLLLKSVDIFCKGHVLYLDFWHGYGPDASGFFAIFKCFSINSWELLVRENVFFFFFKSLIWSKAWRTLTSSLRTIFNLCILWQ